ncbi:radical SAM protein [Chloroflexota bacterium]
MTKRLRKSKFVRLFDKTPEEVLCPHFYELILSNGCPYDCSYCYLKLTFRGNNVPTLFLNDWSEVRKELDQVPHGVFSTGELADSLAIPPPLLPQALDYFERHKGRQLLLVSKSDNIHILADRHPSSNVIVSFSVNSSDVAKKYERGAPDPMRRFEAATELRRKGWRVRIRLDPIVLEKGMESYRDICSRISRLQPETVTIGSLRHYPGLFNFAPNAPREGLSLSSDRRMRYSLEVRRKTYQQIADWLGFQPSLCKETRSLWDSLGWQFHGCNCTTNGIREHAIE